MTPLLAFVAVEAVRDKEKLMYTYSVTYDLHKVRNYQSLWNVLNRLGGQRVLESQWLVRTQMTAPQLRDHLRKSMDNDDSIVVLELKPGSNWAAYAPLPGGITVLQQHVLA